MSTTKSKPKKAAPVGRPSKYTPVVLTQTREYIASCRDSVKLFHKTRGDKSDTFERLVFANIPTKEGLALHLGVHRDTVQEWAKHHPEFSVALEQLDQKQRDMLIKGGLSGQYNPMITKLVLSSNHGMREKTDVTSDDKPLPTPIINVSGDNSHPEDQAA
ncbi:terminase small subunit [Tsuneonella sp. HG222]